MLQGARGSLSQDLVALWVDEYGPALSLMRRIFPPGLMRYLNVRQQPPPTPLPATPSQPQQVTQHQCLHMVTTVAITEQWPCRFQASLSWRIMASSLSLTTATIMARSFPVHSESTMCRIGLFCMVRHHSFCISASPRLRRESEDDEPHSSQLKLDWHLLELEYQHVSARDRLPWPLQSYRPPRQMSPLYPPPRDPQPSPPSLATLCRHSQPSAPYLKPMLQGSSSSSSSKLGGQVMLSLLHKTQVRRVAPTIAACHSQLACSIASVGKNPTTCVRGKQAVHRHVWGVAGGGRSPPACTRHGNRQAET